MSQFCSIGTIARTRTNTHARRIVFQNGRHNLCACCFCCNYLPQYINISGIALHALMPIERHPSQNDKKVDTTLGEISAYLCEWMFPSVCSWLCVWLRPGVSEMFFGWRGLYVTMELRESNESQRVDNWVGRWNCMCCIWVHVDVIRKWDCPVPTRMFCEQWSSTL